MPCALCSRACPSPDERRIRQPTSALPQSGHRLGSFPPPTLRERRHRGLARRRVTARRLTIFVGQDSPQPRRSNRGRCCFHDTAHESAIGENVEVVIASLAGRARGGRTFKTNVTSPSPQSRCAGSLDHLVRDSDDTRRNCQTERLRSVDIDHQLELGRRLYRKVDRFFALEHAAGVDA